MTTKKYAFELSDISIGMFLGNGGLGATFSFQEKYLMP